MTLQNTISRSVKYGLHFVGIWPGTPYPGLRKIYWLTSTALWQMCQYKYIITHFKTDSLVKMIDCLSISLPYTLLIAKLSVAWSHHGVLCDIITTMEEDCVKYAVLDTNNMISKTADLSYRLTSALLFLYLLSPGLYLAGTFAFPRNNDSTDRQLLLNMDFPFNINESPTYELVVTAQIVHQTVSVFAFGIFSSLLLMMILHAGCHVNILCHILTNVTSQNEGQLRFVAVRHQEIIIFVQRIEELYSYISFSQLLSNTLSTCCLGFLILTSLKAEDGLPMLLKCCWFYIVLCFEVFIYCFAGEYLNMKSKMIIDAACRITWYDLQPSISRQLVLLILRCQKGLPLTFGKFSPLNLESFTSIMKASASYMSVLLAMS